MKGRYYTGVTVALCFLMVFTCLGFCSSNRSLYLNAITVISQFSITVFRRWKEEIIDATLEMRYTVQ